MRPRRRLSQRGLDAWFGTIARYCGLLLLVYSVAVDRLRNPALLPTATSLIFVKSVIGRNGDSR